MAADDLRYIEHVRILTKNWSYGIFDSHCTGTPISGPTTLNESYIYTDMERHRPKPLILTPTAAKYEDQLLNYAAGTWYCTALSDGDWAWTHPSGTISRTVNFDSSTDLDNTSLKASSNLANHLGSFGEDLHDLTDTGEMILRRARQIASMANNLRRGNWLGLAQQLKSDVPGLLKRLKPTQRLANGWLEIQFGWQPLVQDVYVGIDTYRSKMTTGAPVVGYSSNGVKSPGKNWSKSYLDSKPRASARQSGIVANPQLRTLNQLGLANPALIAWQILPFSFIVDWFLPISKLLAYFSDDAGLVQLWETRVSENGFLSTWTQGGGTTGRRIVLRTATSRPEIPGVTRLSSSALGIWHAITASALVRQSFHR